MNIYKRLLILALYFTSVYANANIKVAFVTIYDSHGNPVILEKNGKFAHIAISYKNLWLHSFPQRGVELVTNSELESFGEISDIITVSDSGSLDISEVRKYFGKSYDPDFSWTDDKIYCSELVAKILGIKPTPMEFDPELWPPNYQKLNGRLGISPDDIYALLK